MSPADPQDIVPILMTISLEEPPWKPKITILKGKDKPWKALLLLFNLHDHEEKEGDESILDSLMKQVQLLPFASASIRQAPITHE